MGSPGVDEIRWLRPAAPATRSSSTRHRAGDPTLAQQAGSRRAALPGGRGQPGWRAGDEHGRRGLHRPPARAAHGQHCRTCSPVWNPVALACYMPITIEDATGTLGERAAERRGQAHQPLEPDLGKPRGAPSRASVAEDERRECGRRTATTVVRLWLRDGRFVCHDDAGDGAGWSEGRIDGRS